MTLEQTFLDRIAAEPENALHRQIYADWLEEQGDPRGELLRIQEQLRTLDVPDRPQVEQRMHELIAQSVEPLTITRTNSTGMKFVLIFPGQFLMGSPPEEEEHRASETQVQVTLTRGFWLGQYQVTQEEYDDLMPVNPSYYNQDRLDSGASRHPVEQVEWKQAMEFCQKLTAQERAAERLAADWEYTLPTEAQWEYGCRAGTTTATAFGNSLSSKQANFDGSEPYGGASKGPDKFQTVAVGSYPPNAWNLYDMHGNVREWCRDWFRERLPGGTDPEYRKRVWPRVSRGGSWDLDGKYCRSAYREHWPIGNSLRWEGFRVALIQPRIR